MNLDGPIGTPTINSSIAEIIDTLYEMRLETLLSVDDLVAAVVKVLEVCCSRCHKQDFNTIINNCITTLGEKSIRRYLYLLQQ